MFSSKTRFVEASTTLSKFVPNFNHINMIIWPCFTSRCVLNNPRHEPRCHATGRVDTAFGLTFVECQGHNHEADVYEREVNALKVEVRKAAEDPAGNSSLRTIFNDTTRGNQERARVTFR